MYYLCTITFLLLCVVSFGETQVPFYNNTNTKSIKAIGTSNALCASSSTNSNNGGLLLLTNSTTECLTLVNGRNGSTTTSSCSSFLQGAIDIYCLSDLCFILNPSVGVIAVNSSSGTQFGSTFAASVTQAIKITAISTTTNYRVLVVSYDGTTSTVWSFTFTGTGSAGTNILQLSGSVAGLFFFTQSSFGIATLHGQTIQTYTITGTSPATFGPSFTSIESVSIDYYGRVYVYDLPCACIKVLTPAGGSSSSFLHNLVPQSVSHTREAHFVVDTTGITAYYEVLSLLSVNATNATCQYRGGSAQITVSGGASPYTYSTKPVIFQMTLTDVSYTFTNMTPYINYTAGFTVYSESLSPQVIESIGSGTRIAQAGSNIVTPHSGNYSYCFYLTSGTHYQLVPIDGFDATLLSGVEMWVNPGAGGQAFNLNFGNGLVYYFYGGDFALNNWTKLRFDFTQGNSSSYQSMTFSDMAKVTNISQVNPFCIDDVVLTSYDTAPYRKFYATDFCSNTVETPNILFTEDYILRVNVSSSPTTCNPNESSDPSKANDGDLYATASGGTGSYSYSWSFSNSTATSISGLAPFNGNLVIYDNAVATGFSEVGTATSKIIQDPTYYHSAPYSVSFAPTSVVDNLIFNFPQPYDTRLFSAIEFWMYTGAGGQAIDMYMLRGGVVQLGSSFSLAKLAGVPYLEADQWLKVYFPVVNPKTASNFTGIMIVFNSQYSFQQPRVWFDDITMISTSYVASVKDSSGCIATNSFLNVTTPAPIASNVTTSNVKCYGGSNGGVSFSVSGGTAPYLFTWSDSSISTSVSNSSSFSPSEISTSVTDVNGCTAPTVYTYVAQPPALVISTTIVPISCNGDRVQISATAVGGTGPYTYSWASSLNSSYSAIPKPLPLSAYSEAFDGKFKKTGGNVSIVCAGGTNAPISSNPNFTPSHEGYCSLVITPNSTLSIFQIGCTGCIDTSLYQTVQLFIALENPSDLQNLTIALTQGNFGVTSPLRLGNYTQNYTAFEWMKVTYTFESFAVGLVDSLLIRSTSRTLGLILVDDVVLIPKSSTSSSAGINVRSGYQSTISGSAQTYTLTVTDGNGCVSVQSFNVSSPSKLAVVETVTDKGDVSLNITGGVPPYRYSWDKLTVNASSVKGLASGSYTVSVSDSYGCSVRKTIVVVNNSSSSITGILAGSITGAGVLIIGLAAVVYWRVNRRQKMHVQALLEAEEGERKTYKIDFDELTIGTSIGAGSFGEVYSGEYKGTEVAVKKLKSQQMTKQQIQEFAQEASVMVGLRNPNIVLFMGVCLEPEKLCIVTEMMTRGDLGELLRNPDIFLPPAMIYKMAQDTLKGLQFIHSSGFIHRDLKSPNLLVDRSWNIKIADFGLSVARHNSSDEAQISLLWTAPEILNRAPDCYSFASDVFSFAVIMWELMSRKLPWEGVNPASITAKVVAGSRPPISPEWEVNSARLINMCWLPDPLSRPTVKEARSFLEREILSLSDNGGSITYSAGSGGSSGYGGAAVAALVPPPAPPLALVVARVSNSAQLWEKDPRGMVQAVDSLTKLLKENCAEHSGYEISSESTFVYAFAKSTNAVNFCLSSQHALLAHNWPASILQLDAAKEEYNGTTLLRRGLRVRMGVHWCSPTFQKDAQTGKPIYGGSAMETAPLLPLQGNPGTIVIDADIHKQISVPEAILEIDPFAVESIGAVQCDVFHQTELHLYKIADESLKALLSEPVQPASGHEEFEPWFIDFKDIKFAEVLGSGSFGEVFAASYKGKRVAAKKFLRHKMNKQVHMEMRAECALLQSLNHPNILQFVGMCMQSPNLCLVTAILEKGSLAQILYAATDIPWRRRIGFALDAAKGMMYLHQNDIMHRDIKSNNLLVDADWSVKIADFGFSRIKAVNQTMTQVGTVAWTAPEIFDDSHYTEKADVYSFGIVLWEIIFRNKPWAGKHAMRIIQAVSAGQRPSVANMPHDVPEFIKVLMEKCWTGEPTERPTFVEIVEILENGLTYFKG